MASDSSSPQEGVSVTEVAEESVAFPGGVEPESVEGGVAPAVVRITLMSVAVTWAAWSMGETVGWKKTRKKTGAPSQTERHLDLDRVDQVDHVDSAHDEDNTD